MANVTAAVRHSTQYDVGSIMGCLQGSSTSDCGKLETGGNGFHVATYFFIEFLKFKIQFGTTTCPFDTFPGSRMRNCFCEKGGGSRYSKWMLEAHGTWFDPTKPASYQGTKCGFMCAGI